jgi:release factor glutamine methyltransferase
VSEVWTPLKVLEWTTKRFEAAGNTAARLDAQILLAHVLQCDRMSLYTGFDRPLAGEELAAYRELIKRRLSGEPTAYLIGEKEFWSLTLRVDPRVLVPRPDTELLVEVALELANGRDAELHIAEIATGSGAVSIALARELPGARFVATDVSGDALEVAARNAAAHEVDERIAFRVGDLGDALDGERPFDLLIANLPYIPSGEIDKLSPEVRSEPRLALDGGADGLDLVRRLVGDAPSRIAAGGAIALEHGADQALDVEGLMADEFDDVTTRRDLAGHPRVTYARQGGPPTLIAADE